MFAVTVTFKIKPEHWETFMKAMKANANASKNLEEGCRQFDVCSDAQRPYEVFLYELYDDAAAFDTHLRTDHYLDFSNIVAEMVEDKSVATYGSVA